MINEKELNTNTFTTNTGVDTTLLQTFENELSWEIEKFTYDRETLIEEVFNLIEQTFSELTEAIKKHNKLIFSLANNSSSLVIEYKPVSSSYDNVVTVTDLYIN